MENYINYTQALAQIVLGNNVRRRSWDVGIKYLYNYNDSIYINNLCASNSVYEFTNDDLLAIDYYIVE